MSMNGDFCQKKLYSGYMERFRSKEAMPKGGHDKARHEAGESGDHNNNLFDEEGDMYGNRIDPATGERINMTPETSSADEELTEVDEHARGESRDILGDLPEEHDAAAEWLRQHAKGHTNTSGK
jgi:hypothetical protein